MTSLRSEILKTGALAALISLAACSGGGAPPSVTPATTTPSLSQATTSSTSGIVVDLPYDGTSANPGYSVTSSGNATAGAPIANALVFVGPNVLAGATAPSTVPPGFAIAVTSASGSFTISHLAPGPYAITIFAPAPHVTIVHRDLTVASPANAATTYYMTAPSASESAWFAQENADRSLFSAQPTVFDESAVEAGRYWAEFMQGHHYFGHCIPASDCVSGDTTPPPAAYGPQDVDPQHRFRYFHGLRAASEGENIAAGFATWAGVDAAFMAEQSACPNDSALNCSFTDATGHFLNIINTSYVWTGFGLAALAGSGPYYDQEFTVLQSATPSTALRRGMPLTR